MTSQNAAVLSECPVWARGNFSRVPLSTCCCQNASFALNSCNLSVLVSKLSFFFPFVCSVYWGVQRCPSCMPALHTIPYLPTATPTVIFLLLGRFSIHTQVTKFYHGTATGLFVTVFISGSKSCWSKYQHSCETVASYIHTEW